MSKPDTNAVLGNTSSAAAFIASSGGRNSGTCYIACFEHETSSSKACRGGKDNCAAVCYFPGIVLQRLTGGLDGFTANSKNPTGV